MLQTVPAPLEPTPKDIVYQDGTASLYRFRPIDGVAQGPVVLLVPSLINRWYVLDLSPEATLAGACVKAGLQTYLLDWGIPQPEDRYLTWEDVIAKLHRAVRRTKRHAETEDLGLLGYCIGATLCGIYTALYPEEVATLINLAGPFDFSHAGMLGTMVDPRWFDPRAITEAGNISAKQMQEGFLALRPTSTLGKWVGYADKAHIPSFRDSFSALDGWASDNIPFPAAAYVTYIEELYQENRLIKGEHYVGGKKVDLGKITCPTLTIATDRDHICPEPAARGLHTNVSSPDKELFVIRGGHVGAVVGSRAPVDLYPKITSWFTDRLTAAQQAKVGEGKVIDVKSESARKAAGKRAAQDQPPSAET